MSSKRRTLTLSIAALALASPWAKSLRAGPEESGKGNAIASLGGASAWLNSPPLTAAELQGKVVLVEFWTYSCINWRREFPYVRAWAAKYKDKGLGVIGVHTPEFEFETDVANVSRAVKDIGVHHPVAIDSNRRIWRAFDNEYWPALYFIDARGHVRHRHHGEGDYAHSERVIRNLLAEAGATMESSGLVEPVASGAEAPADWQSLRSSESYVGYGRARNLVSGGAVANRVHVHEAPGRSLRLDEWALAGAWALGSEAAVSHGAGGRIAYQFHARDLHLVMGSGRPGKRVEFSVSIDGKPPGASHGADVDGQGRGSVAEPRMYQLIRQVGPVVDRHFEIEFLESAVEVYAFTFG